MGFTGGDRTEYVLVNDLKERGNHKQIFLEKH